MAKEQQDIPQDSYNLSLGFKATTTTTLNDDVSQPKAIFLFGARISAPPQESSPFYNFMMSPKKAYDDVKSTCCSFNAKSSQNLKEDISLASKGSVTMSPTKKRGRTSMMLNLDISLAKTYENLKTHTCLSSQKPKEEDSRKIKKMKQTKFFIMELDLNFPPTTIIKELTTSDVGNLSRLMLETSQVERHILSNLSQDVQRTIQEGNGVRLNVYDYDTDTYHFLIMKRMVKTTRSYVLNNTWIKEFVKRRDLKQGDKIGLFCDDSTLFFHVRSRAQAKAQKNSK
ncbi:unnamed protein product [Cochlearia groenlandica]